MNYLDYIDWRGDIQFSVKPFNDIDNAVLAELSYVNMDDIVSGEFDEGISFSRLLAEYRTLRRDQSEEDNDPIPILEKAAGCDRYSKIRVCGYTNITDKENVLQMSAVTFRIDPLTIYVAYRGTDKNLFSWREDFNFGYLEETPGQAMAKDYLNMAVEKTGCNVYVGGHSKGGNFAVYSAAFCSDLIRDKKLLRVYSNDGPGFKESIVDSPEYAAILDKIVKIVPQGSIIGTLLFGKEKMRIIQSGGKGFGQHSMYNWQVMRDAFQPAKDLTYASTVMDVALDRWVEHLNTEQRQIFIDSLFDSMEEAGYTTMHDVMEHKFAAYNAISKASRLLDENNRNVVSDSLKKLASISKDVLWNDAKKKFVSWRND